MDFTFICPTEIAEFGKQNGKFHRARRAGPRREHRHALRAPGVAQGPPGPEDACPSRCSPTPSASCRPSSASCTRDGVPLRATFIVDPTGTIRWASVNDLSVGRNVPEVLRVLDGLQTDELCPCNWKKGEETLTAQLKKAS